VTVLAVAQHRHGALRDVSLELLSAGRELADDTGRPLHAAVVGGPVDRLADRLARDGVDTVHTIADGEPYNHDVYAQALVQLTTSIDAELVLTPGTAAGMDYAPALAGRLDRPLVADVVGIGAEAGLTLARRAPGSALTETVAVDGEQAVIAVRPGQWPRLDAAGDATVAAFDAAVDESAIRSTVTGIEASTGDIDLTTADTVVAVGRAIGSEANLEMVVDLADAIDATVAGSGPPVKKGWLPPDRQVGQSGVVVAPSLYIAVGISGSVQHVAGMADSDTIVAINSDPTAPIFDVADYGVVGDLFEIVPALTAAFHG